MIDNSITHFYEVIFETEFFLVDFVISLLQIEIKV